MIHDKTPNKKLGQHFLKDQKTIRLILDTMPIDTDVILEIGPGMGAITNHLIPLEKKIILVEKDTRFAKAWSEKKIECIEADALKISWEKLLSSVKTQYHNLWLVSNLPYNISAPLTVTLLSQPEITHMTLMYQKEVAEKILGSESMCSLHVLSSNYFEITKVALVKPGAFYPPPKVDSMVLNFQKIARPKVPLEEFQRFEQFLRKLFAYPRKQLSSVLFKFMSKDLSPRIQTMEIDLKIRAEKLSLEQVLKLYQLYSSSSTST